MTMNTVITISEFVDRIREHDSCNLSYKGARALAEYVDDLFDRGILDEVHLGDWAILTHETTLADLIADHPDSLEEDATFGDVLEAVQWDFMDNCYVDAIQVDDDTIVMVSL